MCPYRVCEGDPTKGRNAEIPANKHRPTHASLCCRVSRTRDITTSGSLVGPADLCAHTVSVRVTQQQDVTLKSRQINTDPLTPLSVAGSVGPEILQQVGLWSDPLTCAHSVPQSVRVNLSVTWMACAGPRRRGLVHSGPGEMARQK